MAFFLVNFLKMMVLVVLSKVVQSIVNLIYGPNKTDKNTHGVFCYDILYDWKQHPFQGASCSLFTLKFIKVRDISWIDREDVSLYTVTKNECVFVRSREGTDIYNAEEHPFLYVSKHNSAQEVGRVPREVVRDYLKSCGKLERDGSNIAILHNIGRCGSTLMTSMVNKTKQCDVLSEPQALLDVVNIISRMECPVSRDAVEYYDLVKETLLLLTPNVDKNYFIKTHSQIIYILPLIHQVLPGIREAFMYRSLRPTVTSFLRAFSDKAPFSFVENMFIPQMPKYLQEMWKKNRVAKHEHATLFLTLVNLHIYFNEAKDRNDIKSFSYESLVADNAAFCKGIFREIGIDEQYVDLALSAMKSDSQKNSILAKSKVLTNNIVVSDDALGWGKEIGRILGIEMKGHDFEIANIPCSWDYVL